MIFGGISVEHPNLQDCASEKVSLASEIKKHCPDTSTDPQGSWTLSARHSAEKARDPTSCPIHKIWPPDRFSHGIGKWEGGAGGASWGIVPIAQDPCDQGAADRARRHERRRAARAALRDCPCPLPDGDCPTSWCLQSSAVALFIMLEYKGYLG